MIRLLPNLRVRWEKLFDKYSIIHVIATGILSFLFGFFPGILFASYYDISQSYMYHEKLIPQHWTWLEKSLFASNKVTDLYDILVWDLGGAFLGALIRFFIFECPFYGFLGN